MKEFFCMPHGIPISAYARQHDFFLASLCYSRRKMPLGVGPQSVAVLADAPTPQSKYVAPRVSAAVPRCRRRCTIAPWCGRVTCGWRCRR